MTNKGSEEVMKLAQMKIVNGNGSTEESSGKRVDYLGLWIILTVNSLAV